LVKVVDAITVVHVDKPDEFLASCKKVRDLKSKWDGLAVIPTKVRTSNGNISFVFIFGFDFPQFEGNLLTTTNIIFTYRQGRIPIDVHGSWEFHGKDLAAFFFWEQRDFRGSCCLYDENMAVGLFPNFDLTT